MKSEQEVQCSAFWWQRCCKSGPGPDFSPLSRSANEHVPSKADAQRFFPEWRGEEPHSEQQKSQHQTLYLQPIAACCKRVTEVLSSPGAPQVCTAPWTTTCAFRDINSIVKSWHPSHAFLILYINVTTLSTVNRFVWNEWCLAHREETKIQWI